MWGLHLIPLDTEMASHLQMFFTKDILCRFQAKSKVQLVVLCCVYRSLLLRCISVIYTSHTDVSKYTQLCKYKYYTNQLYNYQFTLLRESPYLKSLHERFG